jgi:hypothetical protein
MSAWSKADAVRVLRTSAGAIEDDEQVALVQSIADYIDSTADHRGISGGQQKLLLSEVAMAYVEGYEHGTGERAREAWTALRAAGLSL